MQSENKKNKRTENFGRGRRKMIENEHQRVTRDCKTGENNVYKA